MSKQQIIYDSEFEGHPIQANGNMGIITNIVAGYHERLHHMVDRHCQVAVMHLVTSIPAGIESAQAAKAISKSVEVLKKNMQNKGIDVQMGWVREQSPNSESDDSPHYHIGIIADGAKTQSGIKPTKCLKRLMSKYLEQPVSVHCCPPDARYDQQANGRIESTVIKIRRNEPHAEAQFDNAFNRLSYTAKTAQKGNTPHRQREFGFTRIPQSKNQ